MLFFENKKLKFLQPSNSIEIINGEISFTSSITFSQQSGKNLQIPSLEGKTLVYFILYQNDIYNILLNGETPPFQKGKSYPFLCGGLNCNILTLTKEKMKNDNSGSAIESLEYDRVRTQPMRIEQLESDSSILKFVSNVSTHTFPNYTYNFIAAVKK